MKWLLFKLPLQILTILLLGFFLWQLIVFFRPRPPEYTPAEVRAIELAADRFIDEMLAGLATLSSDTATVRRLEGPWRVGVAHLLNDPHDRATLVIRERLGRRPEFEVHEGSIIKKFLGDVTRAVSDATTLEEVLNAGRRVELDIVMAGSVEETVLRPGDAATARLDLFAWDVHRGQTLLRRDVEASWEPSVAEQTGQVLRGLPRYQRILLWLALVVLTPWLTAFATHRVLEKKSNAAGFLLILAYTVFGTALAIMLNKTAPGSPGFWWQTLLALLCTAIYSFWACEKIASKAG